MDNIKHTMGAGEFKAKCLQLMDDVNRLHQEVVITKHGKPIAKLVPFQDIPPSLYGHMKASVEIVGDIVEPIQESWDAAE